MPRKKLPLEKKKIRLDLYVVKEHITQLGEDNIKQECAKTIETMLNNLK